MIGVHEMKIKRLGNLLVVRLDENEEVISSLGKTVEGEGLASGVILSMIGARKNCRLILKKGLEQSFNTHMEILGNGNLSSYEEKPFLHIHVSAGSGDSVWVGHLLEGVVDIFCEIIIMPIEGELVRKYNSSLAESGVTVPFELDFR